MVAAGAPPTRQIECTEGEPPTTRTISVLEACG
jgi:hypothetical protein